MDVRLYTRLTNLALVTTVGMISGHLLMPIRGNASAVRQVAFATTLCLVGAVAAWRERLATAENDSPRQVGARWLLAGAALSVVVGALAWFMVHG